jgi:hypothetical protein
VNSACALPNLPRSKAAGLRISSLLLNLFEKPTGIECDEIFFFFFWYRVSLAFSPSSFFFSIFNCLRRRLFVVSERSVAAVAFADECVLDCRSCVFVEKTKQNLPRNVLIGAGLCWCPRRLRSVLFCHSFCVGRASVAGQPSLCFLAVPLIRVTCFPQTNRTLAPTSSAHQEPNALLPLTPVQPPASAQPSKS